MKVYEIVAYNRIWHKAYRRFVGKCKATNSQLCAIELYTMKVVSRAIKSNVVKREYPF